MRPSDDDTTDTDRTVWGPHIPQVNSTRESR